MSMERSSSWGTSLDLFVVENRDPKCRARQEAILGQRIHYRTGLWNAVHNRRWFWSVACLLLLFFLSTKGTCRKSTVDPRSPSFLQPLGRTPYSTRRQSEGECAGSSWAWPKAAFSAMRPEVNCAARETPSSATAPGSRRPLSLPPLVPGTGNLLTRFRNVNRLFEGKESARRLEFSESGVSLATSRSLLSRVNVPADLKQLAPSELLQLCRSARKSTWFFGAVCEGGQEKESGGAASRFAPLVQRN